MPTYETAADVLNAQAIASRLSQQLGCEALPQPPLTSFDYLFRFPDGAVVAVEIKRRRGSLGKPPLDRTVWLSLHKREAAIHMGLPLWFVVSCDNGDFVWLDEGEQIPIHITGRTGRPVEKVLQIPVSRFIPVGGAA